MDQSSSKNKKLMAIFAFCVLISFFSSMSKLLIPGAAFAALQADFGCSAAFLTAIGSAYMYAYALSQLALGLYSDRYGGVRILLVGGTLFAIGSLLASIVPGAYSMLFTRALTGFGAGTLFVCLNKLISDLFPKNFTTALGIALFTSYLGPILGGLPTVWMVEHFTWRPVMLALGLPPAIAMLSVWCLKKGTMKPVLPGTAAGGLRAMFSEADGLRIFAVSSIGFGIYYAILTGVGQKALEDSMGMSRYVASGIITMLAALTAIQNLLAGCIQKLFGSHRKLLTVLYGSLTLFGSLLGAYAFLLKAQNDTTRIAGILLTAAYFICAIPAGGFSLYGGIVKELYPEKYVSLSVSMLNFAAFVLIALCGNIASAVLKSFSKEATNGIYPPAAYMTLFILLGVLAVIGLVAAIRTRLPQK